MDFDDNITRRIIWASVLLSIVSALIEVIFKEHPLFSPDNFLYTTIQIVLLVIVIIILVYIFIAFTRYLKGNLVTYSTIFFSLLIYSFLLYFILIEPLMPVIDSIIKLYSPNSVQTTEL